MSRLLKRIPCALLRFLITLFLSLGLGMPIVRGAGFSFLLLRFFFTCFGTAAFCALLGWKRGVLPLSLAALAALQVLLAVFGKGFFRDTIRLVKALTLYLKDVPLAVTLNSDALCSQLAVFLTLFCYALSGPDVETVLPVTITAGMLSLEWMLGLRGESLYMLPVLPALYFLYAQSRSYEDGQGNRAARVAWMALPAAAVLVALTLLLSPSEGTRAPLLSEWAEELREAINDRFFFQQQRAWYELALDGWMPQGEKRLGGEPMPSERLVMRVETDRTVYLRGAILDSYTGAAWYDSISARRYYYASALQRSLRDRVLQKGLPLETALEEKQLSVHFLSAGASTLFVPQRLRELTVGEHMTPYFNLGSEIFLTRNLKAGDEYTLRYVSMKATDSGMAALARKLEDARDEGYPAALDQYTVLPDHIQREVYDIADAVTENCRTPWEKAVAIRDYLKGTYAYSHDVRTPPRDVDFVAWFLLAEKKGYCTYFASAMTVLCRMAGLPARYIEGYVASPGGDGMAEVRGTNAHAWTEVYLNGLGWVTFDATPGRGDPDRSGSAPAPQMGQTPMPEPSQTPPEADGDAPSPSPSPDPTPSPEPAPTPSPEPSSRPDGAPDNTPTPSASLPPRDNSPEPSPSDLPDPDPDGKNSSLAWLWILLILLAILLAAWRIRVSSPLYRSFRMKEEGDALMLLWQGILVCCAMLKAPIRPDETPIAFARRAENVLDVKFEDTARAVSALRYGRHMPLRSDLRTARSAFGTLRSRLSLPQKGLLALRYACAFRHPRLRHGKEK